MAKRNSETEIQFERNSERAQRVHRVRYADSQESRQAARARTLDRRRARALKAWQAGR